jgi:hypothetical protein
MQIATDESSKVRGDALMRDATEIMTTMRARKEKVMKAEDKKLIEEVEALDRYAHTLGAPRSIFIARARELLPKLAARLKELASDAPPPPPKLPEPLVDGFYWVRCDGRVQVSERRDGGDWWLIGGYKFYEQDVRVLAGPLLPPADENVTK